MYTVLIISLCIFPDYQLYHSCPMNHAVQAGILKLIFNLLLDFNESCIIHARYVMHTSTSSIEGIRNSRCAPFGHIRLIT